MGRSPLGQGTEVCVLLPRISGEPDEDTPSEGPGAPGQGETVLLVEDEAAVRRVVRRILVSAGYSVVEAEDGAAAIELSSQFQGDIDLLVTDVVMPRMGGPQLARKLWEQRPGLAAVFLSGYARDTGDGANLSSGEFIQKPFSRADLLSAVHRALENGERTSGKD